jgi:hypothetical protein
VSPAEYRRVRAIAEHSIKALVAGIVGLLGLWLAAFWLPVVIVVIGWGVFAVVIVAALCLLARGIFQANRLAFDAELLAKRFWELRTFGENLPPWEKLTPEERQRKCDSAAMFINSELVQG